MKICPLCRDTVLTESKKFCWRDGKALLPLNKCQCGKELDPAHPFCAYCGKANPEAVKA